MAGLIDKAVPKRSRWLLGGVSLVLYAHALLLPAIAVGAYAPVAPAMACSCAGHCSLPHDDSAATTGKLFAACGCGCADGAPDHYVDARRMPLHLAASASPPHLIAAVHRAAPPSVPDRFSVCARPLDKIPI